MLSHPEEGGQSRDQQTKPKVQVLNPGDSRARSDGGMIGFNP